MEEEEMREEQRSLQMHISEMAQPLVTAESAARPETGKLKGNGVVALGWGGLCRSEDGETHRPSAG